MRRTGVLASLSLLAFVLAGGAASAQFFSSAPEPELSASGNWIDPLTGKPIVQYEDGRARATPIPREVVASPGRYAPGTVVVSTEERRLYYVLADGKAVRYPVAVGHAGMAWAGTANVDRKGEWPDWNPPPEMLARRPDLPKRLEGGPTSPIGARALYLAEGKKDTLFRIHGTNEPEKIGQAVSSGCIRMLNDDVVDLYDRVPIGAKVVVR